MKGVKLILLGMVFVLALAVNNYATEKTGDAKNVEVVTHDGKDYVTLYQFGGTIHHIAFEITGSPASDYWFAILMNNLANKDETELTITYDENNSIPIGAATHFIIQRIVIN